MLECLIVVLPGIITAFIHSKLRKTMNWKRLPIYIILYSVCINLIILGGLWIIGMRNFNLFDMSLRFKIKWLILGLGLGLLGLLIEYIHRTKWSLRMHVMRMMERIIPAEKIQLVIDSRVMYVMKKIFPSTLLLVVTYTVFTPNALFLNNIGEFKINYN